MAYAKIAPNLTEKGAVETIFEAQKFMGFSFKMVQSDNGAEFQRRFQERLNTKGIKTRHSRVRHPNDDAHIERFNRTLREEFIDVNGVLIREEEEFKNLLIEWLVYYNSKRPHFSLNLKAPLEFLVENNKMSHMYVTNTILGLLL